jgi:hypothetical protein
MKIRIYFLRLAAAVAALVLGISVFSIGQYFQSDFQTKEQKTESVAPVKSEPLKIDELIYPPRKTKQAEMPVVDQTETTEDSKKETEYEFDAGGDYYIIGDLPKGFKDFDTLSITTKDYENASKENNWEGVSIPPKGYILMKKEFKFVRINIADKQIAFVTGTRKGISYKFVGKFIAEEEIKLGEYSDYAVIEGSIIKMHDGKKIAESKVKLGVVHGC